MERVDIHNLRYALHLEGFLDGIQLAVQITAFVLVLNLVKESLLVQRAVLSREPQGFFFSDYVHKLTFSIGLTYFLLKMGIDICFRVVKHQPHRVNGSLLPFLHPPSVLPLREYPFCLLR